MIEMGMADSENIQLASSLTRHDIIVLLVDDQAMVGEAVRRMLAPEKDIVFHYCQDPGKAIEAAAAIRPTVILQDLVMPEVDGLTLVRFFRAHPRLRDVPLIVLSSREEATTKAEAFALGANDYLVKLPDRIELIARIRYHSRGYINLLQRNEAYEALVESQKALADQLASAAEYVISLLPAPLEEGEIRTEWRFVSSTQLGGDSFGYHWIDDEHFAIYLLDVCDHGVGPALLSVSVLNVLRSHTLPEADFRQPGEVLCALNDSFQMEDHNNLYFTMWYGVFNRRTRELRYASAGHPPALLLSASGDVAELRTPNLLIGGMPDMPYESRSLEVPGTARLFVFSDGVYEVSRPDDTMWTFPEFRDFLVNRTDGEGSEVEALYRHIKQMHGEAALEDDFSMLKVNFQ